MVQIKEEEELYGDFTISKSLQRNVVLVGRTRTGKSTIKTMLINPMVVAEEQQLMSGTKDPTLETFHISRKKINRTNESSKEEFPEYNVSKEKLPSTDDLNDLVVNIIDTPGLFERGTNEIDTRDNEIIMKAIDTCINGEITKFHVICFCVALTSGINQEDIQALKLLLETIGNQIASNACLIITHSESKKKEQRKALRAQLMADKDFKDLEPYFKKGIFFSGVLKQEDYLSASKTLIDQYLTVADYRVKLIKMFSESVKPFPLVDTLISESKRAYKSKETLNAELEQTKTKLQHTEGNLAKAESNLLSKAEELQQMLNKFQDIETKLFQAEKELQQTRIDLEEKNAELVQIKSTEASLRKMIKELENMNTLNEHQRKELQASLELEEKQRQEAEAERQREMEARREAEKQRLIELERRRSEQAEAHAKYCQQVEAQREEARQRKQAEQEKKIAEQQLEEEKKRPCTIS